MIGQTLGHCRILEKIGTGGMGEVYRAEDLHLARDVAIKVLPAGTLADEQARRRFRKEAEALSKLNHPNIQTVHDFDTQGDVDFLVVELVPGPTLAEKLAAGALPEKEIASLGVQIAAALEEAHERGVVHCDLKPGNIKVTPKGQVKVLDFGIAKLLKPFSAIATTESFTETQAVAGTLPYMAPEQLRGEAVDARADIWAAGVVLYEIGTARRPFEAKIATALAADIQHKPVTPPGQLNPKLSSRLQDIILKCLEKEPENRYQSAKELGVDLRRLAAPTPVVAVARRPAITPRRALLGLGAMGVLLAVLLALNVGSVRERLSRTFGSAGAPKIESLAMLPLENLSRDPEQEYFADGMTEALITELSKISALRVISRTSAMQYKGVKKPLPQIAQELGVDALVEGSVLREGDQVRITVQLLHGPTDRHLWAENYQRELRGILALQSEVARAIANQIRIKLTPQEQARLASAHLVNPAAQEAYLKGRFMWNRRSPASMLKAIEFFQEAIELDPTYAAAYAGLADSYNQLGYRAHFAPAEAFPRAKAAARKALDLDAGLAEAYASLGFTLMHYEWDWAAAEGAFQRAIALNPSYAEAHHWYSHLLTDTGRAAQSLIESKLALEFDPLSLIVQTHLGWHYDRARQYDLAIEQQRKTLEMDPIYYPTHLLLGWALLHKGLAAEAIPVAEKVRTLSVDAPEATALLGTAYAAAGRKHEAMQILKELERISPNKYVSPYDVSLICSALGENERALQLLEQASTDRAGRLIEVSVEPVFDPLRSNPRFQALLRRMNFPQ